MKTLRTLAACTLALAASWAFAQDKAQPAPKAAPKAAATPAAATQSKAEAVPRKATVDTATAKPAAGAQDGSMRYKSKDGSPCHHDKASDA